MKNIYLVLKNELNHLKTISILTSSVLAFDFVMYLLSNGQELYHTINASTNFLDIPFYILSGAGTFIVPIYIFSYMQETTTMTHLSSLPIKRYQTFLGKYLAGVFGFFIPLVIYLLFVATFASNLDAFIKVLYPVLLYFIFYYSLGCLAALLSGTKQMMVWLSLILYFLPVAIYVAIMLLLDTQVYGLEGLELTLSTVCTLLPAIPLIQNSILFMSESCQPILLYPLYGLVVIVICFIASYYRKHEYIGETIISKIGLWFIKDVVIIVGAWYILFVFYSLFFGYSFHTNIIFAFCYVLILGLVNYIATLIFHKKLKFTYLFLNYLITCALSLGFIFIGCDFVEMYRPASYQEVQASFSTYNDVSYYVSEDEVYKEAIEKLHDALLVHRDEAKQGYYGSALNIYINYVLSNGDTTHRVYEYDYEWIQDWLIEYEDSTFLPYLYNQRYQPMLVLLEDKNFNSLFIGDIEITKSDIALFTLYFKEELNREYNHEISVLDYFNEDNADYNEIVSLSVNVKEIEKDYLDYYNYTMIYGDALDRAVRRYKEVKQIG